MSATDARKQKMTSLTIVHIEDEYSDFLSLTTTLKTLIEEHWHKTKGTPVIAARRVLAECEEKPPSWIAFEMTVSQRPGQTFRWIFVRDALLPREVRVHMEGRIVFILDVLRPDESGTTMRVSLSETLLSIKDVEVKSGDVVVYTAYQGTGVDSIAPDLLAGVGQRIRKENDYELDDFLSGVVLDCVENG